MKMIALSLLALLPGLAAANYAECLLKRLPGTGSDAGAKAIAANCMRLHPGGFDSVPRGSGRGLLNNGLFGYANGFECASARAKSTTSNLAAGGITAACRRLYDPPPAAAQPGPDGLYFGVFTSPPFLDPNQDQASEEDSIVTPP